MRNRTQRIAKLMGAKVVGKIPDAGGGAFGAARLPAIVNALRARLKPGRGLRPGRPTNPKWVLRPKVPMSAATEHKLVQMAEDASREGRKISPMQIAAELLELAVKSCE